MEIPVNWMKLLDITLFLSRVSYFKIAHLWKTISNLFLHINNHPEYGTLAFAAQDLEAKGTLTDKGLFA